MTNVNKSKKPVPILFTKKEDCCGCGACLNKCPKQAIKMYEDKCGFIYPVIKEDKCVRCGQCKKVCAFQNEDVKNSPIECFAAISMNSEQAKKSASAGVFAAIATKVIERGGIVYGAAFDETWKVRHILVETIDQLVAIQGSKYVHSDIENKYSEIREQILIGKQVLFSGTPCQVAGLQSYLGEKYDNLLTIDIVCHGVPSNKMFHDYIKTLESKHGGRITAFTFRDKTLGWGINGSAVVNGKRIIIWQSASSYLYYFTNGWIYRENCYKCPYACEHRPADITLGDYWGIEKEHPELLGKDGWDESNGISCVITNTEKGQVFLKQIDCKLKTSSFEKIRKGNAQLLNPCKTGKRTEIIKQYEENEWNGLEKRFNTQIGLKKYSSIIKRLLPTKVKRILKSI